MLIQKHAKQNLLSTLYSTQEISVAWESNLAQLVSCLMVPEDNPIYRPVKSNQFQSSNLISSK